MWWLFCAGVLFLYYYFKISNAYQYWDRKRVLCPKPLPLIGNIGPHILRKCSLAKLLQKVYNTYPHRRYVGFYLFLEPILLVRDPDLIKQITVKEANTFADHNLFRTGDEDHISNKNIFNVPFERGWKRKRATLSPIFTSSKMRGMFALIGHCVDQFTKYFEHQEGIIKVSMKDAFCRYTNDVIATTAFGATCNSLQNPENDLFKMGEELSNFKGFRGALLFFGYAFSPLLMRLLKFTAFSEKSIKFFETLIKATMKYREENQIVRPDIIHLLNEARMHGYKQDEANTAVDSGFAVVHEAEADIPQSKQRVVLTDEDIVGQCVGFFLAGFETSSTVLTYATYELAVNPAIQERLYKEVLLTLELCNGKITYESLLGMKYLDCFAAETLRKWGPAILIDRKSIKPFTIMPERPDEKPLHLEAGSVIWIPGYAIHRDEQYYPDPEVFDPERFNDENKHKVKPFTYLPFGLGARSCIGSRFALLESKLLLFNLLLKFEIVPVKETPVTIEISKKDYSFIPDGGIWLGLKSRNAFKAQERNGMNDLAYQSKAMYLSG